MKLLEKANGNLPRTEEEKEKMIEQAAVHYGQFLEARQINVRLADSGGELLASVAFVVHDIKYLSSSTLSLSVE